ncbi:transketolase [Limosilactobacillus secaliphilus]|uniref:Transketolase n=1 Tax=Limosilactobacillus secaliphilus TaxID=396268 RepID=A0A0R2I968_9LACO|nr:transketolase [Limosilactobacillus secaliphilus]KRN58442.1 transketolase [Limosilactobacillus secaliphilus]
MDKTEMQAVDALRFLSADMIEKANSGHPGVSIDAAPIAYGLWEKVMNFNPEDPTWLNRDRFVLSAGHGSALLYSLLYFNGFGLTLDDTKRFRQLDSKTPGHPEYGHTAGIDATTGPLSQGIAMSVGMAMAEKHLAAMYNKPGYDVIDHYTYSIIGDGDLMEGLSEEAINLAGDKGLSKLIVLYDSNDVSLDGPLDLSTNESVKERVLAAGWDYQFVSDGNTDVDAIVAAIRKAQKTDKPSMIEVKTTIGYGTPQQGTNAVHGAPLGEENLQKMRDFYNWDLVPFEFTDDIQGFFDDAVADKRPAYEAWSQMFEDYAHNFPAEAKQLTRKDLDVDGLTTSYKPGDMIATRVASAEVMGEVAKKNPEFWGGAADLFSSNKTYLKDDGNFTKDNSAGRNVFFGVREFGMAAATNGMNLHGGDRAYCSTFFVFTDYLRAAVRLAALMHVPSIFIGTHDSIAVGEDGPTHEPVEQLTSFRAMPNLNVIRPADANEAVSAWKVIGKTTDRPTMLVLTRQKLPVLKETENAPVDKGAYVVSDAKKETPDGILIAAGSEVSLALTAQQQLAADGIDVRVVSMPSMDIFNEQPESYRESVLPKNITKRVAIEMGASMSWYQYVGLNGKVMGVDRFGASGKGPEVVKKYGFTPENVVKLFKSL